MSELAVAVLAEIRDSARKALDHAARGGHDWHNDELVMDAVANRVRQVTELAKYAFPEDEKMDFPQLPWDDLARARDFYTHHYSRLDPERLRETVEGSLRDLLAKLERLEIPEFAEDDPQPGP
jgi:uncharacterized protein with HEPN domain